MAIMRILLLLCLFGAAYCAPSEDLIVSLPGLSGELSSEHYSGYLQASEERFHFYWFVESQSEPSTDPVILWLNGGPGCSSLLGFFTELGPYTIHEVADDTFELQDNIYAWNTVANVLFMESPVCVGFSYEMENSSLPCRSGDITTAEENYRALTDFFTKFPEYQNNDFYIMGESYAGIYIPTMSVHIVENQDTFPINFKGFGLGNALTSYENSDNSMMFYAHYHAMLDISHWTRLVTECCDGVEGRFSCNFYDPSTDACRTEVNAALDIIYNAGINFYNIIADCQTGGETSRTQYDADLDNMFRNYERRETRADPPCLDYTIERNYLNKQDVRDAIHVSPNAGSWSVCDTMVGIGYSRDYLQVRDELNYLLHHNLKGLIFSGDTDIAVNFIGNEWDITLLDVVETEPARTWEVNGQVAGFVTVYENLDFVTVRASGHMVPEDKPPEALHMLISYLNDIPY